MPDEIEQEQLQAVRDLLDKVPEVRRAPWFSEEDKQQLALAAKAAGLAVVRWTDAYMDCGYHSERYGQPGFVVLVDGLEELWNPRDFDGDALRLAVKLEISVLVSVIHTDRSRSKKWNAFTPNSGYDKGEASEFFGVDSCASCRRAIVRAAAEIGANMQS